MLRLLQYLAIVLVWFFNSAPTVYSLFLPSQAFFPNNSHIPSIKLYSMVRLKLNLSQSSSESFGMQKPQQDQPDRDIQWRSTKWVLLVDDEESIRNAIGQLLTEQGYQVTTSTNGESALRILTLHDQIIDHRSVYISSDSISSSSSSSSSSSTTKPTSSSPILAQLSQRSSRLPDAIVSDVRMPGTMDGLQLLGTIRAQPQLVELPVILLTAKSQSHDRILGYQYGADAYLPKPVDPAELVAVIDSVIQRHEELNPTSTNNNNPNKAIHDLKHDLEIIKHMILEEGGGGKTMNGWVESTNVFLATQERQVLDLLCQGLITKEIANRLFLSTRRIEQLLTTMFQKTKTKNRTELVRWAISTGNVKI